MKKQLLPLILVAFTLFTISCSTDNSNIPADNANTSAIQAKSLGTSDFETAKRLYADMVITQDYIDFKSSIAAFTRKLEGNNVMFITKSEWMTWITTNLSATSFTSVAEFEAMFDDAEYKMNVVMAANTTFYGLLAQADSNQYFYILHPGFTTPEYPANPQDCTDDCITACELAIDASEAQREANMTYVSGADEEIRGLLQSIVQGIYDEQFEQIVKDLNDCIGAC
jgi:hypothetical protein